MANVSFKRGLSAALVAEGFSAQDGVFYLTTDTHRLYVGQQDKLIDLNRYIRYVNSASELSNSGNAVGDFVFIKGDDDNQLCVWDGKQWLQINPDTDTNDNTKVTGITTPTVASDKTGITVSFNLQQTTTDVNGSTTTEATIPVSFKINSEDFATANEVAVGIQATAGANETIDLGVKGAGSDGSKVNIKAGDNATVALANGGITISAKDTTYTFAGADNKITMSSSDGTDSPITVASGAKITATVADNTLTIAHAGLAAPTKTIEEKGSLEEGGSITVVTGITSTDGHITGYSEKTYSVPDYADTKYAMAVSQSENSAKVDLVAQDGSGDIDTVMVAPGTDMVVTADADAKSVQVAHKVYSNSITPTKGEAKAPGFKGTITALTGATISNGHLTGLQTTDFTLPEDIDYSVAGVETTVDDAGGISVKVTDAQGTAKTGTAEKAIYFKVGGEEEKNIVYNHGVLDVYTKSEIDNKINGIDAMRYKGTVGGDGAAVSALPGVGNVSVGDTYMVAAGGDYGGYAGCDIGDLLIATGVETDGVITSGLAWTYVPAGDDTDTQFALQASNNVITLQNTTLGQSAGDITIQAGGKISVNTAGNTIEIAHTALEAPEVKADTKAEPAFGNSFNVISAITADDGHITEYHTQEIKLPVPIDYSGDLTLEADHVIKFSDANGNEGQVVLGNDNYITLEDDLKAKTIKVGHKAYNVPLAATPEIEKKLNAGDNFTAVIGVERDAGGHLSKFATQKFTLPADNDTTYSISATENETIKLIASNDTTSEVKFVGGKDVVVSEHTNTDTGLVDGLAFAHANVAHTTTNITGKETPAAGTDIKVVKSVSVNNQGHVSNISIGTITLPADNDTTYTMSTSASASKGSFTTTLTDSHGTDVSKLTYTSKSLTISNNSANSVGIELEWGSF